VIEVFYSDLRVQPSLMVRAKIEWQPSLTALEAISRVVGEQRAEQVAEDLITNQGELMVFSWRYIDGVAREVSGVGRLDWDVDEHSVLSVNYENELTTSEQIEAFDRWCLKTDEENSTS
jgi:hypothetical protein